MIFGVYALGNVEMKKEVLRSRKIKESELFPLSECNKLFQRLCSNDTVVVYSVRGFVSVNIFYIFTSEVLKRGASLKVLNEHYLDVGNGKIWKDSVQAHVSTLIEVEQVGYDRLVQGLRLNKAAAQFVAETIGGCSVNSLSLAFGNNGILHRG